MARKNCPGNFYEKNSETLIGDNAGKGYNCLWVPDCLWGPDC